MKKFLICVGFVATSLLNSTAKESEMAGAELQRLIECSARDAAFQAEMEVSAAMLDAISALTQRVRDMEGNIQAISIYTNMPGRTAATKSEMTAAQLRLNEVEKCMQALSASADNHAVQATTLADLNNRVVELENLLKSVAQASDMQHLAMRMGEIEERLNGTCANMVEAQEQIKVADAHIATMKNEIRRRL